MGALGESGEGQGSGRKVENLSVGAARGGLLRRKGNREAQERTDSQQDREVTYQ